MASRIAGNVGLLGEDYAGYFSTGDTRELARLMARGKRFGVPGRIEIAVRATGASVQPRTRTGEVETLDREMKRRYVWRELFTPIHG